MDPRVLDQLDGLDNGVDGFFDSLGSVLKSAASKALPVISQVFTGQGSSTVVGAVAAYVNSQSQKKLIDAQAKLAQAQTEADRLAAQAKIDKAKIDVAASQTVVNGIDKGIIPPDATYAQAGQIVVREVVKSAGVSPTSPQGAQATRIITQAAQSGSDNTLLYVGGGIAALGLIVLLATRRR